MATTVETMSLPFASSSLLDAAAAAEHQSSSDFSGSAAASGPVSAAATADNTMAATAPSCTTPQRLAGLAAVTPSTLNGTPESLLEENQTQHQQQHPSRQNINNSNAAPRKHTGDGIGGGGEVLVSASSTEETGPDSCASSPRKAAAPAPVAPAIRQYQPPFVAPAAAAAAAAAAKNISKAAARPIATPSIHLGPRVSPAVRKSPPKTVVKRQGSSTSSSPVKPRNLGLGKTGDESFLPPPRPYAVASFSSAAVAGTGSGALKQEECPSTPAAQKQENHIPAPSSFLAAKISPLRSSSKKSGDKKGPPAAAAMLPRNKTPPLAVGSSNLDTTLTPGMFLSPRTPKSFAHPAGLKSSGFTPGFTPGLTPGLTPTNFASDFGRGHKKEGSMNALDASNVFAWLNSPTGNGLFSPNAFNSLSATNTPRGMYGFTGPAGPSSKSGIPTPKLAPSLLPSSSASKQQSLFAELESGGDIGVNTPKIPDSQRSMICISPLASKRGAKKQAAPSVPDTPMSINFSEVFASPRYPTPRLSRAVPPPTAVKKEDGVSSDGQTSPVASALHTAERDINLDDDLNALLQLAETTTPGGRPMTFMSPLLTSSLRRASTEEMRQNGLEPPSSLQLPIISGSSIDDLGSPQKLSRKGSSGGSISPPQLAIRSTSSGSMGLKSSLKKKKSKKRKSPDTSGEYYGQQQQQVGYSHPSMSQYRHPHAAAHSAAAAPGAHNGYYHHPGYHASSHHAYNYRNNTSAHPAPQQHYAYADQKQAPASAATASVSPTKEVSPVKPSRKKSTSKSRSRGRPSKSAAKAKSPVTVKSSSRPTTPSTAGKRVRKSSAKASSAGGAKKSKNAVSDPADKERITAAIYAVNTVYGDGTEKTKKLAAATLRGVTQRPSGKWQAQLYYTGKSRYIGVFDSKEKASLAYEIAREVLKTEKGDEGPQSAEETDRNVTLARKAAFAGVNEHVGN